MKEVQFIAQHEKEWQQIEDYIDYQLLSAKKKADAVAPTLRPEDFLRAYRRLSNQLAFAKTRRFSQLLVDRLHELAKKSHQVIYQKKDSPISRLLEIIVRDFPVAIRREKVVMGVALFLFLFPALSMYFLSQADDVWTYGLIAPEQMAGIEEMYEPSEHQRLGESRGSDSDVMMFGVYIWNNVGIGLRSFASGLVLCIGAIISLVFNGAYFGAITGHLTELGYANQTLYPFVIAHGSLELTAIIIAAGAGIRLGLSLLFPGRLSRLKSVQVTFVDLMPIVVGFTVMLVLAAFIEAFWSALPLAIGVKYTVGAILWGLVIAYFLWGGRRGS